MVRPDNSWSSSGRPCTQSKWAKSYWKVPQLFGPPQIFLVPQPFPGPNWEAGKDSWRYYSTRRSCSLHKRPYCSEILKLTIVKLVLYRCRELWLMLISQSIPSFVLRAFFCSSQSHFDTRQVERVCYPTGLTIFAKPSYSVWLIWILWWRYTDIIKCIKAFLTCKRVLSDHKI